MTKKYSKKKSKDVSGPNAVGPGFRTPRRFKVKASMFSGPPNKPKNVPGAKFNPSTFKVQHKG